MNPLIDLIQQRNSFPRLLEPAPDQNTLLRLFEASLNVPDHLHMRPWRFLSIRGDDRVKLGKVFAEVEQANKPNSSQEELSKKESKALRAPLIVIGICSYTEHEKVPEIEQQLSTGCVLHNLGLALYSLNFASVWRTGSFAFDKRIHEALDLKNNESIMGFLYIGTANNQPKAQRALNVNDYLTSWP